MIAIVTLALVMHSAFDRDSCVTQFPHRAPHSAKQYFNKFDPIFLNVASARNLDPKLLKSIAWCETRLDPCSVSPVGARGIMQFMPGTFDLVSKAAQAQNPFDPIDSIESAGVYVSALSNYWQGDMTAIIASYNAGPGNVSKARKRGSLVPNIPETQGYVRCVLGAYQQLQMEYNPPSALPVPTMTYQPSLRQTHLLSALFHFFLNDLSLK